MRQPLDLIGERGADGNRQLRADDGVGAEQANRGVGHVHAATFAFAGAAGLAHHLGHHRFYRHAHCQGMAVAAIGAGNSVARFHRPDHTRRTGFLTNA